MLAAAILFIITYSISMTMTSVFYHRALTHKSLILPSWVISFIGKFAMPIIGIDPKTWICMHRLHHQHSDTELDPHSPVNHGPFKIFFTQHNAFEKVCINLLRRNKSYTSIVEDIPFDIHWLTKKGLWWTPFVAHAFIGLALSYGYDNIWLGMGYFFGIAGHPIQGFLVNSFGHWYGYENFNSSDNSKNNTFVAWTVFGEGYQNNHHEFPESPKFSLRWFEFDPGYIVVNTLAFFKIVKVKRNDIPSYKEVKTAETASFN